MRYYRIPEDELFYLIEASLRLEALENGGVDNWWWFGDSYSDFLSEFKKQHLINQEEFYFYDAAEIAIEGYILNQTLIQVT